MRMCVRDFDINVGPLLAKFNLPGKHAVEGLHTDGRRIVFLSTASQLRMFSIVRRVTKEDDCVCFDLEPELEIDSLLDGWTCCGFVTVEPAPTRVLLRKADGTNAFVLLDIVHFGNVPRFAFVREPITLALPKDTVILDVSTCPQLHSVKILASVPGKDLVLGSVCYDVAIEAFGAVKCVDVASSLRACKGEGFWAQLLRSSGW